MLFVMKLLGFLLWWFVEVGVEVASLCDGMVSCTGELLRSLLNVGWGVWGS